MSGLIYGGPKRPYFELCICLGSNPATPTFFSPKIDDFR